MPSSNRRQALNDSAFQRHAIGKDQTEFLMNLQRGTHAYGLQTSGTVRFPRGFRGTPHVMLQFLAGTSNFGAFNPLRVTNRQSGSFTYAGSPNKGTFSWIAFGSARL